MANTFPEHLKLFISQLPLEPGVYRYYDKSDELIYIGKAKKLKNRVSSYFQNKQHSIKTRQLVKRIHRIEYTLVNTEYDALLLENTLIKKHQPKYNVALRDDKTYPFIFIPKERFPRIYKTRNPDLKGGTYYGPYSKASVASTLLDILEKVFFIRTCAYNLSEQNISDKKYKVCMEYHLGNCLGPCEDHQKEEDYNTKIEQCKHILNGNFRQPLQFLALQMQEYARNLEFEKASSIKYKIDRLKAYQEKSEVVNPKLGDITVLSITSSESRSFINHLKIKSGSIVMSNNVEVRKKLDEEDADLLLHYIFDKEIIDDLILVNKPLNIDTDRLNHHVPVRGDKRRVLELSIKNALQYKKEKSEFKDKTGQNRILEELKKDLRLKELPTHIECFDNSNIQGSNPVASMVCFKMGKPSKKDYRHFNIKTVEGPNDFDSMTEIVYRRYKRLLDEQQSLPQLVVIDGGKGQLSAAMSSIYRLKLEHKMVVIGIAKRLEELYYPGDQDPLLISKKSESMKVLQHLRNEAHRFAITFHRNKRSANFNKSELDQISGIGEKTKTTLLQKYRSLEKIRTASETELAELIGSDKAQKIINHFS